MELVIIQQRIYEICSQKVMLDFDLASLYEVETKVFNQAVKRNSDLFPEDFMFRLTKEEWKLMSSQFVMTSTSKKPKSALPYVFTGHGVTMLASILKSEKARKMNIAIVRAFIALRKMAIQYADVIEQITQIKERVTQHDAQLNQIYDAIENLLDDKAEKEQITKPEPIGFKIPRKK